MSERIIASATSSAKWRQAPSREISKRLYEKLSEKDSESELYKLHSEDVESLDNGNCVSKF